METPTVQVEDDAIVFRTPTSAEAARLTALMRELFVDHYSHSTTPENVAAFLDGVYTEAKQRAELADPHIDTFAVERGDDWIGFAQLRYATSPPSPVPGARPCELGRIYLSRAAQGAGVGRRLVARLEQAALARGRDALWLSVWQEAPWAIGFYRRMGFEIVGTAVFTVGGEDTPDWLMAKRLQG